MSVEDNDIQEIETTKLTPWLDKNNVDNYPLKQRVSETEGSIGCYLNTDLGVSDSVGLKSRKIDMKKESHVCIPNGKSIPEMNIQLNHTKLRLIYQLG